MRATEPSLPIQLIFSSVIEFIYAISRVGAEEYVTPDLIDASEVYNYETSAVCYKCTFILQLNKLIYILHT